MTKRKRTPPPSPPPRATFQIPASLQRLSVISRSLAQQSDKLAGVSRDGQNMPITAQAQAQSGPPPATSAGMEGRDGQGLGFRAFAPRKQPSFSGAQTWVEPKPRRTQVADEAGLMPTTQPSVPQGQAWPQPQPQTTLPPAPAPAPASARLPPSVSSEAALMDFDAPLAEGETLCLETQPNQIAALIAQKRAANEANRRREAWTRRAAVHRMSSQAPDDQLLNELNSVLEQSPTTDDSAQKDTTPTPCTRSASTDKSRTVGRLQQYITHTAPITFDPIVPSAGVPVDSEAPVQTQNGSKVSEGAGRVRTSAESAKSYKRTRSRDHDSSFSSAGSSSAKPAQQPLPGAGRDRYSVQQPNQHDCFVAPLSAAASTAPSDANVTQTSLDSAKTKSKSRYTNTAVVRQSPQSSHAPPVAAGYFRFNPKHWQTSSTDKRPQPSQAFAPAAQSANQRGEPNAWPPSHALPPKAPANPVFRNLTQDKFGRFSVGGKL